jgi:talin
VAVEEMHAPQEGSLTITNTEGRSYMTASPISVKVRDAGMGTPGSQLTPAYPQAQRVAVNDLNSAAKSAHALFSEMETGLVGFESKGVLTADQWRDQLSRTQDSLMANVANLMNAARLDPSTFNRSVLDNIAKQVNVELFGLAAAAKNIAKLDDDIPSFEGARSVALAISKMLDTAEQLYLAPGEAQLVAELIEAEKLLQFSITRLNEAKQARLADKGAQLLMVECMNNISMALDDIIDVSTKATADLDAIRKGPVEREIKGVNSNRDWYKDTMSTLIPVAITPEIKKQIVVSAQGMGDLGIKLVGVTKVAGVNNWHLGALDNALKNITDAIRQMQDAVDTAEQRGAAENALELHSSVNMMLATMNQLKGNMTDSIKLVNLVKTAAGTNNNLMTITEKLALASDDTLRERLLKAGMNLSEAMSKLVDSARKVRENPEDKLAQQLLSNTSMRIENLAQDLLNDAGETAALTALRYYSKAATAGMIKWTAIAKQATPAVTDPAARTAISKAHVDARNAMQNMMVAIKKAGQYPDNKGVQQELLQIAQQSLPAYKEAVNSGRKTERFFADPKMKVDITMADNESEELNKKLEEACRAVADLGSQSELDDAMLEFETSIAALDSAEFAAKQGLLVAPPGQTRDSALKEMNNSLKRVETSMDNLVVTAKRGGKLPEVVRNLAFGVSQVATGVKTMAGTVTDRTTQKRIIAAAKVFITDTMNLITAGRVLAIDNRNQDKVVELAKNQFKAKSSLGTLSASAKGLDTRECDEAMLLIQNGLLKLTGTEGAAMPFQQAAEGLTSVCKALTAAVSQLVAMAQGNPRGLGASAKITGGTFTQLIQAANIAAFNSKDKKISGDILDSARNLADAISNLLNSAKYAAAEADEASYNNLAASNKSALESIQKVMASLGGVTAPECDEAIRMIMDAVQLLDRGDMEGVVGKSRDEVLNDVSTAAKSLAQITNHIISSAKVSTGKLGMFAKQAAGVIVDLLSTARAANKKPEGETGLSEDASIVLKCVTLILQDTTDTNKVVAAAKKAAISTSKLIAVNKELAKSMQPEQKARQQNLVQAIKQIADCASRLAQAAQMSAKKTPESIEELIVAAKDMKEKTVRLEELAGSGSGALSSESVDAQIVKQLSLSAKTVAVSSSELIRASAVVSAKNTPIAVEDMAAATNSVSEAIQALMGVATALNPGMRECEKAIEVATNVISDFDAANIALTVGQLQVKLPPNKTPQAIQNDMANIVKDIAEDIRNAAQSAISGDAATLVTATKNLQNRMPIMVRIAKAVASTYPNPQQQKDLMNIGKDASGAVLAMLKSCKAANPSDKNSLDAVKSSSEVASQSIAKLLNSLQTGATVMKDIDTMLANFKDIVAGLPTPLEPKPTGTYQAHRSEMITSAQELASGIVNLNKVNKASLGEVGLAAGRLGETVPKLGETIRKAAALTVDQEARQGILNAGKKVIDCTSMLLNSTKRITQNPNDAREQNLLKNAFNAANASIGELMTAAKKGAVGEMMMDEAIEAINAATGDLNTTSIFAQAGQLDVPKEVLSSTMQQLETGLVASAKKIVTLCAHLNRSATMSEEGLGKLARDLAACVTDMSNKSIQTASRVPDSISQQDILSCAKAVAIATHQILLSGKDVQRTPADKTAMDTLNSSQTGIAEAVNQLINTTKGASEEFARGEMELENAKKAIEKVIQHTPGTLGAKPEDVLSALRMITDSTANIVFASNQEDLVKAAKEASAGVDKMMNAARGAAQLSQDTAVRNAIASSCRETARSMLTLLEAGKLNRQDPTTQGKLEEASGTVTNSIQNVLTSLRALPNAKDLSLEESSNLEALAESELLNAAKIIAEAAKTLMNAKPQRTKPKVEGVIDEEDIVDAIIDAARAITGATGNLVQAATVAQKERKASLNTGAALNKYRNDPTWANGLISAAKNVAGGVQMLVQASNAAVQGKAQEEHLVAAARAVASATAHLVTASRVKSDSNSKAQQNLTSAAKAVANATNELVKAAQHASNFEKEEEVVTVGSGIAVDTQLFNQQAEILRLERKLQRARQDLSKIRKERYDNNSN